MEIASLADFSTMTRMFDTPTPTGLVIAADLLRAGDTSRWPLARAVKERDLGIVRSRAKLANVIEPSEARIALLVSPLSKNQ